MQEAKAVRERIQLVGPSNDPAEGNIHQNGIRELIGRKLVLFTFCIKS